MSAIVDKKYKQRGSTTVRGHSNLLFSLVFILLNTHNRGKLKCYTHIYIQTFGETDREGEN